MSLGLVVLHHRHPAMALPQVKIDAAAPLAVRVFAPSS
jgi:hypothetical protein